MSELEEAQARVDQAVDDLAEAFLAVVALRDDPERHARALVEKFGPAHTNLEAARIEVAMLEAETGPEDA